MITRRDVLIGGAAMALAPSVAAADDEVLLGGFSRGAEVGVGSGLTNSSFPAVVDVKGYVAVGKKRDGVFPVTITDENKKKSSFIVSVNKDEVIAFGSAFPVAQKEADVFGQVLGDLKGLSRAEFEKVFTAVATAHAKDAVAGAGEFGICLAVSAGACAAVAVTPAISFVIDLLKELLLACKSLSEEQKAYVRKGAFVANLTNALKGLKVDAETTKALKAFVTKNAEPLLEGTNVVLGELSDSAATLIVTLHIDTALRVISLNGFKKK